MSCVSLIQIQYITLKAYNVLIIVFPIVSYKNHASPSANNTIGLRIKIKAEHIIIGSADTVCDHANTLGGQFRHNIYCF